jgi:hypothetical protein
MLISNWLPDFGGLYLFFQAESGGKAGTSHERSRRALLIVHSRVKGG